MFTIRHGEFVVIFKSKIAQVYELPKPQALMAREEVEPFGVKHKKQTLTMPDKPKSSKQRYVRVF